MVYQDLQDVTDAVAALQLYLPSGRAAGPAVVSHSSPHHAQEEVASRHNTIYQELQDVTGPPPIAAPFAPLSSSTEQHH